MLSEIFIIQCDLYLSFSVISRVIWKRERDPTFNLSLFRVNWFWPILTKQDNVSKNSWNLIVVFNQKTSYMKLLSFELAEHQTRTPRRTRSHPPLAHGCPMLTCITYHPSTTQNLVAFLRVSHLYPCKYGGLECHTISPLVLQSSPQPRYPTSFSGVGTISWSTCIGGFQDGVERVSESVPNGQRVPRRGLGNKSRKQVSETNGYLE